MKKIIAYITISILLFLALAVRSYAATSPTPKPTAVPTKETLNQKLSEQINQLKEKIASRVSELNLVEKRGIIGVVVEVSSDKITLKDIQGNTRFIDVDEITKFSSASNKSFGISDLSKGTRISALGLYNKQSKRLLARFISASVDPTFINGTINDIDNKNFYITVTTKDNKQVKLDVQTSTKLLSYDKDNVLVKYGFSKLEIGDRVAAIGFPNKKDASFLVPSRIIDLVNARSNPNIVIPQKQASDSSKTK